LDTSLYFLIFSGCCAKGIQASILFEIP